MLNQSSWRNFLYLLPAVLVYGLFLLLPLLASLGISFTEWDGTSRPVFAGISNYLRMFSDPVFWIALGNNAILMLFYTTLMIASAFQQVPKELVEAAVMDGAPRIKILWGILVPAIWPTISTLALLLFIWTWNEFLIPLILVNKDELRTLPIGMMFFQNKNTIDIPVLMAGAMIVIMPLIVVFLFFQRKFISGVTEGAVK